MKVLVTGASEGIGRSFSLIMSRLGHEVTSVARNELRLKELDQEAGAKHKSVAADLTTSEGLEKISHLLLNEKYDLLINNAGLGVYGAFRERSSLDLAQMLDLNCKALVALSQAFLKNAKAGDALVNISSTSCFFPMPVASLYAGTKHFVTGFTESLWFEERSRGVYILALCPGVTETKFHARAGGKAGQLPTFMTETPDQVVATALKHLRIRKHPVVVSGAQKYLIFFSQFLPRKWLILIAGKMLERGFAKSNSFN